MFPLLCNLIKLVIMNIIKEAALTTRAINNTDTNNDFPSGAFRGVQEGDDKH